jgi:hypothetical protein
VVTPPAVKRGVRFSVVIRFANEGSSPIEIEALWVTTTRNDKRAGGQLPPLVSTVAPHGEVEIRRMEDANSVWLEDTKSWSMEAKVKTKGGATYTNDVVWQ